jgi:hypothetical protein
MAHDWQPDFEQLVDEHQSMVFSLAWRMTGDRGLAEEIAQDVFMELDRQEMDVVQVSVDPNHLNENLDKYEHHGGDAERKPDVSD